MMVSLAFLISFSQETRVVGIENCQDDEYVSNILISSNPGFSAQQDLRKNNALLSLFQTDTYYFGLYKLTLLQDHLFPPLDVRNVGTVYLINYNDLICEKLCVIKSNYWLKLQPEKLVILNLLYFGGGERGGDGGEQIYNWGRETS